MKSNFNSSYRVVLVPITPVSTIILLLKYYPSSTSNLYLIYEVPVGCAPAIPTYLSLDGRAEHFVPKGTYLREHRLGLLELVNYFVSPPLCLHLPFLLCRVLWD